MKRVGITWPGEAWRTPTLVLSKAELSVLHDLVSTNPRSQWFVLDFGFQRIYAYGGCRLIMVTANPAAEREQGPVCYVNAKALKKFLDKAKVVTVTMFRAKGDGVEIARFDHPSKSWNLREGDSIGGLLASDAPIAEGVTNRTKAYDDAKWDVTRHAAPLLTDADPKIERLARYIPDLLEEIHHKVEPLPTSLFFRPVYLGTFSLIAKCGNYGRAALQMQPASSENGAAWFYVESTEPGDATAWVYVLMPMVEGRG